MRKQVSSTREFGHALQRALALGCVLLLLVASTVELAHAHGSLRSSDKQGFGTGVIHSDRSCAICAGAHSPALAQVVAWFGPTTAAKSQPQIDQPQNLSLFPALNLDIRPPPQA